MKNRFEGRIVGHFSSMPSPARDPGDSLTQVAAFSRIRGLLQIVSGLCPEPGLRDCGERRWRSGGPGLTSNRRLISTVLLAMGLLPIAGCSKTQDTHPETKIFGDPPIFEATPTIDPVQQSALCDFTDAMNIGLKKQLAANVQVAGPVLIGGTYTQLTMQAKVSDPNPGPSPGKTDILLVSASFIPDPTASQKVEKTLVLFDDGSVLRFNTFQNAPIDEDCKPNSTGVVSCTFNSRIKLFSSDPVANDGMYTRRFALLNLSTQGDGQKYFTDCVATANGQAPFPSRSGVQLLFRVDVVDREGNLTTFPTRLPVTTQASTFSCSGDDCLCCYLRLGVGDVTSIDGQCRGLQGLYGPDYPDGFCNTVAPIP
jgi:hypothetical protein